MSEDRKAETWDKASKEALKNLRVTVHQCLGDEAAGLIKLAKAHFNVIKGSDLFHVQQEITRGLTSPIARGLEQTKRAKDLLQKEKTEIWEKFSEHLESAGEVDKLSKRGVNAGRRFCNIDKEERKNDKAIEAMEQRLDGAKANRRAISELYHPFHPETGEKQKPESKTFQTNKRVSYKKPKISLAP